MRPLRSVVSYLAVVFVGGALVAPWVFFVAMWASSHWSFASSWSHIPFHRFVHRSFIVCALVALPRFLKSLGAWDKAQIKEAFGPPRVGMFGLGAALGFISLAVVLGVEWAAGVRAWHEGRDWGAIIRYGLSSVGAAIVVAVLEEFLFRWALYGALRKVYARGFALAVSSFVYAIVHFFSKPESPEVITWNSGLVLLPRMLRGFGDVSELVPGFICLLVVGIALADGYERTGRLWFSIGLHAGWIFWLKSFGFWTVSASNGPVSWWWGSDKVIDGYFALILIIVCACSVKGMDKLGILARK